MNWSTEIPNEAGWYLVEGSGMRMCLEAVEIAGMIWPAKPYTDWSAFQGCKFHPVIWPTEEMEKTVKLIDHVFPHWPISEWEDLKEMLKGIQ